MLGSLSPMKILIFLFLLVLIHATGSAQTDFTVNLEIKNQISGALIDADLT